MKLQEISLWLSVMAICYSYLGYPILLLAVRPWLARKKNREVTFQHDLPSVAIVIAAYNESAFIGQRVINLMSVDYPSDKLTIYIESDGSTDQTVEIATRTAAEQSNIYVSDHKIRRGKVQLLNQACQKAHCDILVFSDANVTFEVDALKRLVAAFSDQTVGCACGKLCFTIPDGSAHTATEGLYWRLESWLKEQEGANGFLLGANGAIYAVRRNLWKPCPPDTVVEDFFIPARLLMEGFRVVFEPAAVAYEAIPKKLSDEFGRRVRIGAGDFQILSRCWPLLHPRHGLAAWAFFSRKVLRWLGPFFLLISLSSAILLTKQGSLLGLVTLYGWSAFLVAAILGASAKTRHGIFGKLFAAAAHFLGMNLALLIGFFRWLFRIQKVTWQRTAR